MHAVAKPRRLGFEPVERRLGAPFVARDDNDARAHPRERKRCNLADPRRRAGRDHGLSFHDHPLSAPVFGGDPFALS